LNPFGIFFIQFELVSNRTGRHCAAGAAFQRPMPPLPRFLLSLSHTTAGHRAPLSPVPPVSRSRRVTLAPPPSPVTRRRRRPHPPVRGRCQPLELSPVAPGAPSPPIFSPPRGAKPRTPCPLFPLRSHHWAEIRAAADLAPLFSLFFFSICSVRCRLLAPHRACPRRPPVASPPCHRKSEPPWHRVSTSSVCQPSLHHGSQVACTSPSPFPFGTAGPCHQCHP
jgi:hypothetical protein